MSMESRPHNERPRQEPLNGAPSTALREREFGGSCVSGRRVGESIPRLPVRASYSLLPWSRGPAPRASGAASLAEFPCSGRIEFPMRLANAHRAQPCGSKPTVGAAMLLVWMAVCPLTAAAAPPLLFSTPVSYDVAFNPYSL